jgi:hypothetical protein
MAEFKHDPVKMLRAMVGYDELFEKPTSSKLSPAEPGKKRRRKAVARSRRRNRR